MSANACSVPIEKRFFNDNYVPSAIPVGEREQLQQTSTAAKGQSQAQATTCSASGKSDDVGGGQGQGAGRGTLEMRPTPGSIVRVPETHSTGASWSGHHSRSASGSTTTSGSSIMWSAARNGHSRASSVDVRPVQYVVKFSFIVRKYGF